MANAAPAAPSDPPAPAGLPAAGGLDARLRVGLPTPEHAGEALTVQRAAYVTEAQLYAAPTIPPLVETLDEIRADLERAGADLERAGADLVARAAWWDGRLVGSVRGRVAAAEMEVVRFAVAPDMQGRGIGRALLAAVHAAAPPAVTTFWLVTGARSAANLRLYAAAGYRVTGATTDAAGVTLSRLERPHDAAGPRSGGWTDRGGGPPEALGPAEPQATAPRRPAVP